MGRFVVVAVMVCWGPVALGADGVLEINHACASGAGCFAGDGSGYPVTIGARGSYGLTSDLDVPAGADAIEIDANDVTLDLRGFRVIGPYACGQSCAPGTGNGIVQSEPATGWRTVVRDGGVSGFGRNGIVLGRSARAEKLSIHDVGRDAITLDVRSLAFENTVDVAGGRGLVLGIGSIYRDNTIGSLAGTSVEGGRASGPNTCLDQRCGTTGKKFFYMTTTTHTGAQALSACAAGFHMASLWEIWDPSDFEYDTTRGGAYLDAGQGAPTRNAWVRTGTDASDASQVLGRANCNLWTSDTGPVFGSSVVLGNAAWSAAGTVSSPWLAGPLACGLGLHVWCVQD